MIERAQTASSNGNQIVAEEYIIVTHTIEPLNFCEADLTSEFREAVRLLPPAVESQFDRAAYLNFINTFGATVINRLELGGKALNIHQRPYKQDDRNLEDILSDPNTMFFGGDEEQIFAQQSPSDRAEAWMLTLSHLPKTL